MTRKFVPPPTKFGAAPSAQAKGGAPARAAHIPPPTLYGAPSHLQSKTQQTGVRHQPPPTHYGGAIQMKDARQTRMASIAAVPLRGAAVQRMLSTVDTTKEVVAALNAKRKDRPKWLSEHEQIMNYEIETYAKEAKAKLYEAMVVRDEVVNRHKTSWSVIIDSFITAIQKNSPDLANSVLVRTGSWQFRFNDGGDSWNKFKSDKNYAVGVLNDVGRTPINVYKGLGSTNSGKGFDSHIAVYTDGDDGSATPFSVSVMNFTGMKKESVTEVAKGTIEHYRSLASGVDLGYQKQLFEDQMTKAKGYIKANWSDYVDNADSL